MLDAVNWNILGPSVVALLLYGWMIGFPAWYFTMIAVCIAATIGGWIIAAMRDH